MADSESLQSLWNFYGAEYQLVFEIKVQVVQHLSSWNLEDAFWSLRRLKGEIDAKLDRGRKTKVFDDQGNETIKETKVTEKQEMDNLLDNLTSARNIYLQSNRNDNDKTEFYFALENFYLHVCFIMKKHGVYFREGDDMTFAVLRR